MVKFIEKKEIAQVQKQLLKHILLLLLLSFLVVLDVVLCFVWQTRLTQNIFIFCGSFLMFIFLSMILFIGFIFVIPESKYLKVLRRILKQDPHELTGKVISQVASSYEEGFLVDKYEFAIDETRKVILKIENSKNMRLKVDTNYHILEVSHYVIEGEEIL